MVKRGMIQNKEKKMKVIGITGGTGAGKSTVCAELKKRGAEIIDADAISRQVSQKGGIAFGEIVEAFGTEILDEMGEIDRKALGKIVFNDEEKLSLLNQITHKHIFDEMERRLKQCTAEFAVLDVPLLFEEDFPLHCDLTVAVVAEPEIRLKRIMARDNITHDAAAARMKNQISNEDYARLADICVENNGGADAAALLAEKIIKEAEK